MKDLLVEINRYGMSIVDAMNASKVQPTAFNVSAVMVMVGEPESGFDPIGAAINWNPETKMWVLDVQLEMSHPLEEKDDAERICGDEPGETARNR